MPTTSMAPPEPPAPPAPSEAPAPPAARLRLARDADHAAIARIFDATVLLGRSLPLARIDHAAYRALCLDWYLEHGTAIVVDEDDEVRGYLLACLDQDAHARWVRRAALSWFGHELGRAVAGHLDAPARRFVALRALDGWRTWRSAPPPPHGAHAHVNLDASVRGANVGHRLAARMDELVTDAGLDGWFGEVNVPAGTSLAAFVRAGARIVHLQRNATLSWLAGVPIERATIARPLAARTDAFVARVEHAEPAVVA